jgi:hypothetical protein
MATRVFISYRREDSAAHAGRVHDRLEREFGREALFMDVDTVRLGVDFVEVIREEVTKCDVLLAIVGPNWLNASDEEGNRRLDDQNDYVRIEIAAALQRSIPVIPILFDGARIPKVSQLPTDLEGLARRNALDVRNASFRSDIDRLIQALKGLFDQAGKPKETEVGSRTPSDDATAKEKVNASAAPTVTDTIDRARSAAASILSNWVNWAIAAFVVISVLLYLFTWPTGREATQAAPPAVPQSVSNDAMMLSRQLIIILHSLRASLEDVTDSAAATAAFPKLQDARFEINNVRHQVGTLSPDQRKAFAGTINSTVQTLNQLFDKVLAIPGVSEQLKPIVDAMKADLGTLTAT